MNPDYPPSSNLYEAADWLRSRHPLVDQLVTLIAGDTDDWLDEIAGAILDTIDHGEEWEQYEQEHPKPRDPNDETAHDRWDKAGPKITPRGHAYAVMTGEEAQVVRLIATLANSAYQRRVPWSAHDLSGWDDHGAAIFNDWVTILRTQVR